MGSLDRLGDFLAAIDRAGELVRVRRPVSVVREIAEVADRCMKSPGAVRPCSSSSRAG